TGAHADRRQADLHAGVARGGVTHRPGHSTGGVPGPMPVGCTDARTRLTEVTHPVDTSRPHPTDTRATGRPPEAQTLGQLRASGHELRSLRDELRANLLDALRAGRDPWPGMHGLGTTVIPQVERAILAGHDIVLLGGRGQGQTRLMRSLVGLLGEWAPVIDGSELGEHPYERISHESRRRAAELDDDLPVAWVHRTERYAEKLATPDTSVADLIGDVDPMRVAEGRRL